MKPDDPLSITMRSIEELMRGRANETRPKPADDLDERKILRELQEMERDKRNRQRANEQTDRVRAMVEGTAGKERQELIDQLRRGYGIQGQGAPDLTRLQDQMNRARDAEMQALAGRADVIYDLRGIPGRQTARSRPVEPPAKPEPPPVEPPSRRRGFDFDV